jgi:anaerobic glycerol-3-phosphate dehydrogenase
MGRGITAAWESGVALRLPPHSKATLSTALLGTARPTWKREAFALPHRFRGEAVHVAAIDGVLHLYDHLLAAE